jgi:hypothetical protein
MAMSFAVNQSPIFSVHRALALAKAQKECRHSDVTCLTDQPQ